MQHLRTAALPVLAAFSLAFVPGALSAQTCLGNASFATNHLQLAGDITAGDGADEIGLSFASGSNTAFAGLGVGFISYTGDGRLAGRGVLGYQVPATSSGSIQVCPVVRAGLGFGEDRGDISSQIYSLGLAIGGVMLRAERIALVPSVTLAMQHERFEDFGANITDEYGTATFAVGIVLNESLSIRPNFLMPIGARFDEPILGISLSLNFGGRR
jgi:hypothetical protein